jgi:hypothetical protein
MSEKYKSNPDTGSLRASDSKKGPSSPDYWGDISINLKDMTAIQTENGLTTVKLSGWKKVGKDGKTYLSLSVNRYIPKEKTGSYTRHREDDSDIPF